MTEKIYMENPYLREIDADVVEKKYVNNKYYIKLNRTIFYPHLSGGQPGDKGTINGVEVLEAYEAGEDIVHVLGSNISGNRVKISIDWENRLDLMQQHTGQHLLSSVFYKLFNGDTVGFYIGKEYVYIDITKPSLTEEEAVNIEILANRIIYSNFEIKTGVVTPEELEKLPLRKQPTVNDNIRIVEIDGLDYSPCCGTHLNYTGEIGIIKIRKWEKKKGNIRVEFVCGKRALDDYSWKNKYINKIGTMLSSKDKDILDKFRKLVATKENLEKENRELRESLYKFKGEMFLSESQLKNNINFIYKEIVEMDYKELGLIANYLNAKDKLIQIYGIQNAEKGQFYISRSKDLDIDLQEIYKEISSKFEIKGGGNSNTVQGGSNIEDLIPIMKEFGNKLYEKTKVRKS